ncbi:hypothetical protein BMW22_16505 [Rhizobium leguminosarum]|uniref:Uncharacterized protein n=1 Tax=Rhizobium leguminosarum TaxID=384 RepID=A0A1L3ZBH2_RHILE|nr:hypothetical protein BMW22_16505 [Rhizobium leguminosarum]
MLLKLDVTKFSLIPVRVTGIQCAQVLGRGRGTRMLTVIHGADAPWLDSCDEHRNEEFVEQT